MTVGESRSFTPFNNIKYNNKAVYSGMSLSDNSAFDIKSKSSSTNPYNTTYTLTALKTGEYTVIFTIQYKSGNNYPIDNTKYTINVYDVNSISIPETLSLSVGENFTYTPIIEDSKANTTLEWSSDNPNIVSADGPTILARSVGSAIITCKAHNGVKATSRVTVTPVLVNSISLNFQEYELPLFNKLQLIAEVSPSNATNPRLQWSSSNNDIAIVREDGIVIGINCGYALISAKAMDASGVSSSCLVHVLEASQEPSPISISDSECGKVEIKFDNHYSIRPIPNPGWRIYNIIMSDGTILSYPNDWVAISNTDENMNFTIIWENISSSISEQSVDPNIFSITDRTINFVGAGHNHLEIYDIQGRVLYEGPCRNINLPSSGYFVINIDNKIFKIYIQ